MSTEPRYQYPVVILIGAPSGAGKTELSRRIIAQALPFFVELNKRVEADIVRYDVKKLPDHLPANAISIVECTTHNLERLVSTPYWNRLLRMLDECENVVHVQLEVPKLTLLKQYLIRIFTGPARINVFKRIVQISKYKRLLAYVLTPQLSRGRSNWEAFGRTLAASKGERVSLIRAERNGGEYDFSLAPKPGISTSGGLFSPSLMMAWTSVQALII